MCQHTVPFRQQTPLKAQLHPVFLSPHNTEHNAELLGDIECSLGESLRWAEEDTRWRKGKKMLSRGEELHQKGHHVCEFLNIDDKGSNNDHLPACIVLPGAGLDSEDAMPHSGLTGSWWDATIQSRKRFSDLAKVIQLVRIQARAIRLQTPCS